MENGTNKRVGYHYTNPKAYRSMQRKGIDGWYTSRFENFTGLIPTKTFIQFGDDNLPETHGKTIEGLLEPEPTSWLNNPEFPHLWRYLMSDICNMKDNDEVILLSFELKVEDQAYIVDRAHIERELYRESKSQEKTTTEMMNEAFKKYWESRVSVFEYDGNYSAPQLAIWSGVEFDRLKVEWIKPSKEVWKKVIENNW